MSSWSVNSIRNGSSRSISLVPSNRMQFNSFLMLMHLCNFNEGIFKFNQPTFKISSGWIKILRKSFIISIIIDNTRHIIYGVRTWTLFFDSLFLSHWTLFLILAYRLMPSLFFFWIYIPCFLIYIPCLSLLDELRIFSLHI